MKTTKLKIRCGGMWAIVVLAWGMLVWPAGLSNAQWSQGGGYVWTTNPGDKVGIGTPMPAWELEVANLTPGEGAEVGVTANDATGAIAAYSSTLDASFGHYAGRVSLFAGLETPGLDLRADGSNGDIRFYTGGFHLGNERMRIINTGAVGIGTKNPLFGLHIKRGSEYPTTLGVEWEQVIIGEEINKDWFYYSVGGSGLFQEGGTNMIFNSESVLRFSTQDDMGTGPITEHMRLTGDGKVGIGTTTPSPSCKLHVVESPLMLNAIRGESHGLTGRGVEGVSYGQLGCGIYGRTYHPTGWAGKFEGKVDMSGNVGIGSFGSLPNELLEVGGDGRAFFGDGGGSSRKGLLIDGVEGSTAARIEAYDYGAADGLDLVFNTAGGGNVGIGTTSPSRKLSVNGRIGLTNVPVWDGTNDNDLTWDGFTISREGSSRRYKQNIRPFQENFRKILRLEAKQYQMREGYGEPGKWLFGYIAEEIEGVGLTKLVNHDAEGRPDGIKYKKMSIYLNEIVKEHEQDIAELKKVVQAQQKKIEELEVLLNERQ